MNGMGIVAGLLLFVAILATALWFQAVVVPHGPRPNTESFGFKDHP